VDAKHFDYLTRTLAAGSRRGVLRLLAFLPLGGWLALLLETEPSNAKRRQKSKAQGKRRVGASNHKHEHRRRKHRNKGRHGHNDKDKHKPEKCKPQSAALTCDGKCGSVQNNCKQSVDCGSCACDPPCPACQVCDEASRRCVVDSAQEAASCGGCQVCDSGQCVTDRSIVCEPLDQCHDAGECDPATGECTTPAKPDATPCDDGDACTSGDTCQSGACRGTAKDCSSENDVCNDGVCRSSDGACIKRPKSDGTSCNADNTSCTAGDSCQNGVCTPGAGIDCSHLDDACNRGVCRQSDGACVKDPRPDGTPCSAGECRGGVCEEPDPSEVIGSATKPIPHSDACGSDSGRTCESLAGDVITDAMRLTYGTDFALTNSGGIRADLTCPPAGTTVCPSGGAPNQITRGQVLSVLPFGNVAVTLELNGLELKAMLESAVRQMPAQSPGFAQVSGLCFTYDIGAAPGSRITGAVRQAAGGSCSGAAIDLTGAATYSLTTNDFTAGGGDGYPNLIARATSREVLAEVTIDFIALESPLDPHIEGRIVCNGVGCPTPAPA
jgi:hypothetical protein